MANRNMEATLSLKAAKITRSCDVHGLLLALEQHWVLGPVSC